MAVRPKGSLGGGEAASPLPSLAFLLLLLLQMLQGVSGSSSHSLFYFYTTVWELDQGPPWFVAEGYVDDQHIVHYNSTTKVAMPQVNWMKRVDEDVPWYWYEKTMGMRTAQEMFSKDLEIIQYNWSRRLHTWQHMYGCELSGDGSFSAISQYSYNGRVVISFDKETLTWTEMAPQAQNLKGYLDDNLEHSKFVKVYQEEFCMKRLKKFLEYGNKALLRTELPVAKLKRQEVYASGWENLVCEVHGFYPKQIDVFWTKDGEVWMEDTFHRNVVPNLDGTYHVWTSVEIDPMERDLYQCHVEHSSLVTPLILAWEEQASIMDTKTQQVAFITAGVVVGMGLVLLIMGFLLYHRCQRAESAIKEGKWCFLL